MRQWTAPAALVSHQSLFDLISNQLWNVERFRSCIYLVVGVCVETMSQLMRNAQGFDHCYNAQHGGDTKG